MAASANLPTILYSLFWKRFNTTGALWSIYGGLAQLRAADHLLAGGVRPADVDDPESADFDFFPLSNPGIVSIPLSFLLGIVGTYVGAGSSPVEEGKFAEMEVRSLTGAGSEKAVAH